MNKNQHIEIDPYLDIEWDTQVCWIHQTSDASHPGTIVLYIEELPKLIAALQKVVET